MTWNELKALIDDELKQRNLEDVKIDWIDIGPGSYAHVEIANDKHMTVSD